ncbi:hypothetical protein [Robertkochia solimangrovi]|uniref:hypothetical protein n=1 Tax=Robertkochia solimangrovi TaxID=2213046 RepID=UPI00117E6AD0|nr:hypothetical protein [Robertkochia solimangrovi]TRZ45194.1 hypothetical protein DMZ48_05450 [Robertkochia solimangrovi]
MIKRINVADKLRKYRKNKGQEDTLLLAVKSILNDHQTRNEAITARLNEGNDSSHNKFNFDLLESSGIYHLDHIKEICVDYRLRFLETRYFKGDLPNEALERIKKLEEEHQTTLQGFRIVAPSGSFRLKNADDPLLFAPIGNGYYYLIHKWGNDLHPFRKMMVLPFRNLGNIIITTLVFSLLVTAMIPVSLFTKDASNVSFWLLYFFVFKMMATIVIFYGFALGKNFNEAIWNSKYFNA